MSSLIAKNVQIGADTTATNNFTIYQPATPNGTLLIGNGNTGITSSLVTLNSSGNLGLGVTPSAWGSAYRGIDFFGNGFVGNSGGGTQVMVGLNFYRDGTGSYLYKSTAAATRYQQNAGAHEWLTAPSGTAGAAITFTQAMTLDDSGNLGIGTTSPAGKLHVQVPSTASSPNTPLVITDGTTSSFNVKLFNNVTSIVTGGGGEQLTFEVNGAESARIDSSGNLLVGTTTNAGLGISFNPGSAPGIIINKSFSGTADAARFRHNGTGVGGITYSNTATAYATSSDYRLKETIAPMTGALGKVAALNPVTYKWKTDGSDGEGFIAHELAEVCPSAVYGEKDAVDAEGNPQYQGIDVSFLVATLTAAIQELKAIVDTQGAEIAALKAAA